MEAKQIVALIVLVIVGTTPLVLTWARPARRAVLMTKDERDLYAALLNLYVPALREVTGTKPALINLANATTPLDVGREVKKNKECLGRIILDDPKRTIRQVHALDAALVSGRDLRLVDSTQQSAILGAIGHGMSATSSGQLTLEANLLQLSEIALDKTHGFAAIRYTFSCGNVCGRGGIVIFEKSGDEWRESHRQCVGWIS
jgi:hypothetical protein